MDAKKLGETLDFILKSRVELNIFLAGEFGLSSGQYRRMMPISGFHMRKSRDSVTIEPYFMGEKLFESVDSGYPYGRRVIFIATLVESMVVVKKEKGNAVSTVSFEEMVAWFEEHAPEQAKNKAKTLLFSKNNIWDSRMVD